MNGSRQTLLLNMYGAMFDALGPSEWWPGQTPFEVCLGAILTQNTSWANVEKAIWNLREKGLIQPEALHSVPESDLAELIRPAGYFRVKARRLKSFVQFLRLEAGFDVAALAAQDLEVLRPKLLHVKGIGPETADSILLYALDKPSFVVDAYTARICHRHALVPSDIAYDELRDFFMDVLPLDIYLYNEFHALFVRVGKKWCKKRNGQCAECPLFSFLET
jgi:endonuclease-3 related protein